jgi:hypothetical protein
MLGDIAYSTALGRGAAMDDDQVTDYALGEFQRLAARLTARDARAPDPRITSAARAGIPGAGPVLAGNMRGL